MIMKAFLLITLLIGTLRAEERCWDVVSARSAGSTNSAVEWTFTIQNISDQTRYVTEDWRIKGNAWSNLYHHGGCSLFSEPCHGRRSRLTVEPKATITVVILDLAGIGIDRDMLTVAILEGEHRVEIGTLSKITTNKAEPKPESEVIPK